MHIIGKADYYDYLTNTYGVDDLVIYKREPILKRHINWRGFKEPEPFIFKDHIFIGLEDTIKAGFSFPYFRYAQLHLFGELIHGIYVYEEEKFYWGIHVFRSKWYKKTIRKLSENFLLLDFSKSKRFKYKGYPVKRDGKHQAYVEAQNGKTPINDELKQPVVITLDEFGKNRYSGEVYSGSQIIDPVLSEFNVSQLVDPDTMYKKIYNFILENKPDNRQDILTSNEKVISKGFDNKISFRHRK